MKRFFPIIAALTAWTGPVLACEEMVSLDRAQTVDLVNQIRSEETDPLLQLFAFETLMCSDQSGVRDLSLRTAARSSNETIKSQVLLRAMMEKEVVAIELLEQEGLSKSQYEQIAKSPIRMLQVNYRDVSTGCMSMHRSDHCPPYSAIAVQGTYVTINSQFNADQWRGQFKMEGDQLLGTFVFGEEAYPARITLF